MARISLEIFRAPHPASIAMGYQLTAVRLLSDISLRSALGWGKFHPAVVDTGTPVSMLPRRIWRGAEFTPIGTTMAGGILARDECRISVTLAKVSCILTDGRASIGPLCMHASLADSDEAPTLLGIADVLEQHILSVNIGGEQADLEETG
jgi:hypothetical protein